MGRCTDSTFAVEWCLVFGLLFYRGGVGWDVGSVCLWLFGFYEGAENSVWEYGLGVIQVVVRGELCVGVESFDSI